VADCTTHLAAGHHFSGFKSVVGTLWEVDDSVAKPEGGRCHGLHEGGMGTATVLPTL
jgi:hypothetical protein